MKRWYELIHRLVVAVESMANQVGLRRELQDNRIDDIEAMLQTHVAQKRHTRVVVKGA